ncbi:MAG: hypothetical protein ACI35W_07940 [Anaeroplasmataceae bacterium]
MKKYYKNSYLNLVFILISVLYLLVILLVLFCLKLDSKITIILIMGLLSPYIIYFSVGFYWVFQKIAIDKDGIKFYLFNKKLKELPWENIEGITAERTKNKYIFN